jgi:hypothetical protein
MLPMCNWHCIEHAARAGVLLVCLYMAESPVGAASPPNLKFLQCALKRQTMTLCMVLRN